MTSKPTSPNDHRTVIPVPLHHSVPILCVGIVAPMEEDDGSDDGLLYTYAERMEDSIRRIAPDRLDVLVLDHQSTCTWPSPLHVLILCISRPGFKTQAIVDHHQATIDAPIVLTDLDIAEITCDRRIFYDILDAHHHEIVTERLPIRAYVSRDDYNYGQTQPGTRDVSSSPTIKEHREYIDVNGTIIFKPCVERPAGASDDDARVYYPASAGGGCKHLRTGKYFPSENTVRAHDDEDGSYVYEELGVGDDELTKEVDALTREEIVQYWRRNRLKSFAYRVAPGICKDGEAIPDYADDDEVTYDSDLTRPDRKFFIVTTASLPWMTGTAINPLLRAAHLKKLMPKGTEVTLVIPWLELEDDRKKVYGTKYNFTNPSDQEAHVRAWLRYKANLSEEADSLRILWYPGRYHGIFMSIFSTHDVCSLIPDEDADVCVLEEPEHQSWFRAEVTPWTKKFNHVVGVVHTNYKAYVGSIMAPIVSEMSTLVVRAYCHKLIKLSAVLQTFSPEKEVVANVHGVRSEFIREGVRRGAAASIKTATRGNGDSSNPGDKICVYYVGKMLWAKGLDKLLYLQEYYKESTGAYFDIDVYGDGPEFKEIKRAFLGRSATNSLFSIPKTLHEFRRTPLPATFFGRRDHAELTEQYKVFVNPSLSEVLCTTTAEALAMGKFVIIPVHLSNGFFMQFPNCLSYQNEVEFAANLQWALAHEPEPLSKELSYQFTWEAATDRFVKAAVITMREERVRSKTRRKLVDERIAFFHSQIAAGDRGDVVRTMCGLGPVDAQRQIAHKEHMPQRMRRQGAAFISFVSNSQFALDSGPLPFLVLVSVAWLILWWHGSVPDFYPLLNLN